MQSAHKPNDEAISGDCRPHSTHCAISVSQFADTCFADAEMMSDFVHHCLANLLAQCGQRVMRSLQWTPVENDAVRGNQTVVLASFGERDALVQAKELTGRAYPGSLQFAGTGPVGDGYRYVIHVLQDLSRQVGQCLLNQSFKLRFAQDHHGLLSDVAHSRLTDGGTRPRLTDGRDMPVQEIAGRVSVRD